jgi:hypothetical protein
MTPAARKERATPPEPAWVDPGVKVEPAITQRGRRRQLPAEPVERDREIEGREPPEAAEAVITPRARRKLPADANGGEAQARVIEPVETDLVQEDDDDVRFAPEGHHPAETSTGLLSKLRRQPRKRNDHVHKFQESKSSVGLVRRVCTECSYVSIGSDD